jgi:hypothetical protein
MVRRSPEFPIGEVRRLRYQKSVNVPTLSKTMRKVIWHCESRRPVLRSAGMKLSLADLLRTWAGLI